MCPFRFPGLVVFLILVISSVGRAVPVITQAPGVETVRSGTTATLNVSATGDGPLTFQWRKFGAPIGGANQATLILDSVALADAGFYDVVVADSTGSVTSLGGEIRVSPPYYPNILRPATSFAPTFESRGGGVTSVVAATGGAFYAAGVFCRINDTPVNNLARFRADGSLDPTFTPPSLSGGTITHLLRQSDGRLIVVASIPPLLFQPPRHRLIRLHTDGTMDETFAYPEELDGSIDAVALQSDDRLIVAGLHVIETQPGGGYLAARHCSRLHADGTRDTTFQTNLSGAVSTLAVDSMGRVLALGNFRASGGQPARRMVRLNDADGSLDTSFETNAHGLTAPEVLCVLPDRRIVVAGISTSITDDIPTAHTTIVQLNENGTLDPTFDGGGPIPGRVQVLVRQGDGKILIGWNGPFAVTRMLADGNPDAAFAPTDFGLIAGDLALLPEGRIAVGGGPTPGTTERDRLLLRLDADGARDASSSPLFRAPGIVRTMVPARHGAWVVGGTFDYVNGTAMGNIARVTRDGTLAPDFLPGTGFDRGIVSLLMQGDGKLLCAGAFTEFNGQPVRHVARLHPEGTLDAEFAPPLPEADAITALLALQPDGRILAGISAQSAGSLSYAFSRWDSSGAEDDAYMPELNFDRGVTAILPQRNGSSIVAGNSIIRPPGGFLSTLETRMVKMNTDGSLAASFAAGTDWQGSIEKIYAQPDGKLIVDSSPSGPGHSGVITRVNPDGSIDGSFDAGSGFNAPLTGIETQTNGDLLVTGFFNSFAGQPSPPVARLDGGGSLDETFEIRGGALTGLVNAARYTEDSGLLVASGWMSVGDFQVRGLLLLEPVPEPVIKREPQQPSAVAAGGDAVILSVEAVGNGDVTYQWQMRKPAETIAAGSGGRAASVGASDGFVDLPDARDATLSIPSPQLFHHGEYRVVVTANGTSVTSAPVTLVVNPVTPSPEARLLNLSTRAQALTGDNIIIPGFVVQGTTNKRLLIRAVGPTLSHQPYNVPGTLANPRMILRRADFSTNPTTWIDVDANDDWQTNPNAAAITQTAADLFAFAFEDDREAALLVDLAPGQYTVQTSGVADGTGIAIVELYDADPAGAGPASTLVNISNRGFVGVGDQVMIPGFVVSPEGPKTLLIRVVGPTLAAAPYNVPGTMTDPRLQLYRKEPNGSDTLLLTQNNWGDNPDAAFTASTALAVSAFALANGSTDAAFVVTLPPGVYTVVGSSAIAGATGVVLVEVYVVP